ncbi:conserved exported hypothetical protein [Magnetospirillum sp. LM-5]|uniref:DUF1007 family protein n=1 Tax=Magnetospirillum sp. LM-5 TaxID=2681466 RepID=UPI00137D955B|nr:DUF1007 family protein [Magnetospirillum sp. LM-5]CAA7611743.1 conserved exported hypothetical protein [Magnetospirillum sp. LM-5]
MRRWALVLALLLPWPAWAHPHVLIDAHIILLFDKGLIHALQIGWKFDPVYSGTLVADFDQDKSGTLSAKEISAIEKDAFQDTLQHQYFTYASIDGQPVTWPPARDFKLLVQKDTLVYGFRLALPQPVDPRSHAFKVSTYEESFYIDIDIPNDAAIRLVGDGSAGCRATLSEDRANPLLGGAAYPKKVVVTCEP